MGRIHPTNTDYCHITISDANGNSGISQMACEMEDLVWQVRHSHLSLHLVLIRGRL
jgi:hypothetical protein